MNKDFIIVSHKTNMPQDK